jgi:hypothetical protein
VAGRVTLLVDGGIRRGTYVLKAFGLGAKAVLIGPPSLFGLAAGGAAGVNRVVEILRDEFKVAMALTGRRTLAEIDRSVIGEFRSAFASAPTSMKPTYLAALIATLIGRATCLSLAAAPSPKADLVVVGTGISGLAAALDAGRGGANVTVIDMWSVFGGHAVMSSGLVCLVDTPFQRTNNVFDSPDLAIDDFLKHGKDANRDWVRLYARESSREVYGWLNALGVGWSRLFPLAGQQRRRQHVAKGRGIGLISPIYQECLLWPNIHFVWNTKVTSLLIENGQVRGVRGVGLRDGSTNDFRSTSVVLATGGFESNLELVRQHWPTVLPGLEGGAKVLLGSGINSLGSGLEVATGGGAALTNLDHQLFYSTGLVDPRDPSGRRGLNSFNPESIWVNAQGRRFVREIVGRVPDFGGSVPAILSQPQATYWSIFDARGRAAFFVSGSGWDDTNNVQREIFANPKMSPWVKQANSIAGLARATGMPQARWRNPFGVGINAGEDTEWQRFGRRETNRPQAIANAAVLCHPVFSALPQKHGRRGGRSLLPSPRPSRSTDSQPLRRG